jgi:hypothetical protein
MTAAPNPLSREGFGDKLSPRPSRQNKLNTASATWRLPPCRARQIPGTRTQSPQNSGRNRPYTSYLAAGGIGFRAALDSIHSHQYQGASVSVATTRECHNSGQPFHGSLHVSARVPDHHTQLVENKTLRASETWGSSGRRL